MRLQLITSRVARLVQTGLMKFGAILIGSFLTIGIVLCFSLVSSASSHSVGVVPDHTCVPSEGSDSCASISDHISYWQSISTAVFTESFLLLLVSAALLFLWTSYRCNFTEKKFAPCNLIKPGINLGLVLPRSSLQEAFASGIIHSKAF